MIYYDIIWGKRPSLSVRSSPKTIFVFFFKKPESSEKILRILTVVLVNNLRGRGMILKIDMNSFRSRLKQKKTKNGEITKVMLWANRRFAFQSPLVIH